MNALQLLLLQDYNLRVVVAGVTLLGAAAGAIGCFLLLRKRALVADAASHAALPGICMAFMLAPSMGLSPRSPWVLLGGALVAVLVGMGVVQLIRRASRLKEDAALGIVLSVFFGVGVALLSMIQQGSSGSSAGLSSLIYGKTASMVARDAWMLLGVAAGVFVAVAALRKEFTLLCFDDAFATVRGWPVQRLELALLLLVALVIVAGLQAVGLILMIALLVIPPVSARFWTDDIHVLLWLGAGIGAVSGYAGAVVSALQPRLPAGALIVLCAGVAFLVSLCFGARRGLLQRQLRHGQLRITVGWQHLLRMAYEQAERAHARSGGAGEPEPPSLSPAFLRTAMAEPPWFMAVVVAHCRRRGWLRALPDGHLALTPEGWAKARRTARNHRLWELYLIEYADVAPSHVDRDADRVEHVLGPEIRKRLEELLRRRWPSLAVPASPHPLPESGGAS